MMNEALKKLASGEGNTPQDTTVLHGGQNYRRTQEINKEIHALEMKMGIALSDYTMNRSKAEAKLEALIQLSSNLSSSKLSLPTADAPGSSEKSDSPATRDDHIAKYKELIAELKPIEAAEYYEKNIA